LMSPRHRGSSLLVYLVFLLAAFFVPRAAWAADDPLARAQVHFENGVHLYDQKPPDYDAALAEFRAAEKEHASPGIKKNIALCLKALHRYGEAIDELDAMLAAPPDAMKPETREAGKKILAEIQALIATLRIKVVLHRSPDQTGNEVPHVDVALDGQSVPSEKLAGPVRTGPGDHIVVAHATGYGDATKKVSVVAGDKDVLVQLDLVPVAAGSGLGSLHVHSNIARAQISIDQVALANGSWEGGLPAGHHHIEVASEGYPTWSKDIDVANGQRVDLEATLGEANGPPPPPPYESNGTLNADAIRKPAKEPERPWYLMGGVGLYTATYTMNGATDPK
ncbi:MAG: PEGA domain-containing protein, partial [Polyangiaceae bacterium]